MGKVVETVREVNNAVRNAALLGITGLLGTAGYLTYDKVTRDERALVSAQANLAEAQKQVADLTNEIAEKQVMIDKLDTAMRLLKVDQRLASIEILDQKADPATNVVTSTVRFTEVAPDGSPIAEPREFQVQGDTIYIDNWVVKFDDQFIQEADLVRGTSLTLFRRVFGNRQEPDSGYSLDEVGSRPGAYARGGEPSEFEKEIWENFWTIANDPQTAQSKGIRAAHGQAVSMKAEPGKKYRIQLRASDGLTMIPE